ncbi:hypothetical protein HPULCUR_010236 [Helicostylum pulchrum]|uniref:Uncharacterized protein n=1 Tax=Helicostylum pulchrum TaxID=562976 RepID=A0ABP9YCQ5_9FUNG
MCMELEIAIETQEFDNTFLAEIQEASQDLTNTFETLYGNTKDIKKNLFEFSQELQSEKKLIKSDVDTSNNVALIKTIAIVFRTCASISSLMVFETAGEMSAIIGSAVVGGLLVDDQENKSRKSEKLIMVTDNISDQNSELYGSVDTLSEKVYGIKEDIHIFLDGARKTVQQGTNRLVVSENGGPQAVNGPNVGNRLVIKARGMIEGINDLLSQLRGLEVYTTGYSVELRAKIRRESPRSLITL